MASELNALDLLAISKAVSEAEYKAASKATEQGDYTVSVAVRVTGRIRKGVDEVHLKPDQGAIMAAIRLAFGSSKVDAVIASVPPMPIVASGKVTAKLTVEAI